MIKNRIEILLAIFTGLSIQPLFSQACDNPENSHFRSSTIVSENMVQGGIDQVMELDVAFDGKVFFVERVAGRIHMYHPGDDQVYTIAQFDQFWGGASNTAGQTSYSANRESGLLSVATDNNFAQNDWVYILHSPLLDKDGNTINSFTGGYDKLILLERFKLIQNGNSWSLDVSTRKEMFKIPFEQQTHVAGSMTFTPDDNILLISIGDNTGCCGAQQYSPANWQQTDPRDDASRSTANTNDLRGKILRIKLIDFPDNQSPNAGIGTTYEIPAGNLKEEYASLWNQGELNLVKPEIYTMGHRNPFRVNYDPKSKWVLFGENGPAATAASNRGPKGYDEWNVATKATFFGWPFFNGPNNAYRPWDFNGDAPLSNSSYDGITNSKPRNGYDMADWYDALNPVNYSPNNTGTIKLPPAKGAIFGIGRNDHFPNGVGINQGGCTPLAGPVYRYANYNDLANPGNSSKVRFPPFFDGKWFIYNGDGSGAPWLMAEMDSSGNQLAKNLTNAPFNNPGGGRFVDMELGPEGAIYVLVYGTGSEWDDNNNNVAIKKVEYIGPAGGSEQCYTPVPVVKEIPIHQIGHNRLVVNLVIGQSIKMKDFQTKLELYNITGEKIWSYTKPVEFGTVSVDIPKSLTSGLIYMSIK